jgi:hypothetical protein
LGVGRKADGGLAQQNITVANSKGVKTGWSTNLAESCKEGYGLNRGCFANDDDDMSEELQVTKTNNYR